MAIFVVALKIEIKMNITQKGKMEKVSKKLLQNFRLCNIIQIVKFLQLNLYLGG